MNRIDKLRAELASLEEDESLMNDGFTMIKAIQGGSVIELRATYGISPYEISPYIREVWVFNEKEKEILVEMIKARIGI